MDARTNSQGIAAAPLGLFAAYWGDMLWRTVASGEALRQRANNMTEHEAAGMPPLLHFESEQVADGHDLQPASNYRLLRVTRCGTDALEKHVRKGAAPVLVVDPRAGHGPGIGGFKRDSEVGMALLEGHPVYFVVFDPEPVEGQTMGAVVQTLATFIDMVAKRHRGKAPIVYGNCQGGWAITLALSHCEHRAALAVLNGSPLSYWAGERGINPMRLLGGFTGGIWPAHWASDLGAGRFDGAWLVQNFEALRPEGVFKKYDTLFAQPETERDRFLEFERWWNGFYQLAREEMLSIAGDLFVGNHLESGEVVVDGHCRADLSRIGAPLVVFCSNGDNITPPHQALGWLKAVYPTTADLVAAGQRVVYLLHQHVGHLGIFVSAGVARREHRAILHHAESIQALKPGLYEMVLEDSASSESAAAAQFQPRRLEDLPYDANPAGFDKVEATLGDHRALLFAVGVAVGPLRRHPDSARELRALHPMRVSRKVWSEQVTPALALLPWVQRWLEQWSAQDPHRVENPWYQLERTGADAIGQAMESWRKSRDLWAELVFEQAYAN
ncbi:DUF3141 domain-containing protein [Pseudomonas aeruginosa]|uniref:DUF3141 domain-containing protein n=1 Tax=Pseudomonas putida TaxID=303 RepID=UPI000CD3E53E|nr:DUF3141 domain-containing protein [Pseudomonas putida]MCO1754617.1 DUF3141 domain-containing protein [Pseudomonas aeruginosa]MDV6425175.1 DUF3141 domain-containing protein [Pseudomonas aeruginosa]